MKGNKSIRRTLKRIPLFDDEPKTLGELFFSLREGKSRENALNHKVNGKWVAISTDEMLETIEQIALGLDAMGMHAGDRIAILSNNSPKWTLSDAACQCIGIIDVPIYTTLTPETIKYILDDAGTRAIFVQDQEFLQNIESIIPECETLETVILFEGEVADKKVIAFADLLEKGKEVKAKQPNKAQQMLKSVKSDDIATLIYTSGTTGEPKGVMLSHENLVSNVLDAGERFTFSMKDVSLSVLPLSHVFERTGMYLYVNSGMAVYYAESIEKVAENLSEVQPTIFVGVPRIFEKVYQRAKLLASNQSEFKEKVFDWAIRNGKEYAVRFADNRRIPATLGIKHTVADKIVFSKLRLFFGGRLRFCITGGAALSDNIYLVFTGAGIGIMQGYGLTETSPVITCNTPVESRAGSVGKTIRNVEVRIARDGEIEVCGPNIMMGYFNKPEETRAAFTDDGWFKTGDIGELDGDGFLRITDRKKELFKTSGGKYIAPSPIEQMIKSSRFVNQVVLVGNSRKFASALIVPDYEQLEGFLLKNSLNNLSHAEICRNPKVISLFESEINKYCKGLARFESVKKVALIEDELTIDRGELTPTLKLKRRVIDEKYKDMIDEIYDQAEKEPR
ncbi:MAG: AMP-dependent synthetase/ligase [Pyrinomonadaceae bacterium]